MRKPKHQTKKKKEKTKTEKQTGSPWVENPSPRVSINQIRCENPNIKQRKKKAEKQTSSPRVENPSPRVDTVKSDAKTQTSNKEKKGKKKIEKQTSHHQSLIRCKRCEIPCYYQQIRYINNSNVKNTFKFL